MRKLTKKEVIILSSFFGTLLLLFVAFKIYAAVEKQTFLNLCREFCEYDTCVCFPEECAESGVSDEQIDKAFDDRSNAASAIFTDSLRDWVLKDEKNILASIKAGEHLPLSKAAEVVQVNEYDFELDKATLRVVIYQNGVYMVRENGEYVRQEYAGNLFYTFYFVKDRGRWRISEYEYDIQ